MNWKEYKEALLNGRTIKIRPKGNSMEPKIKSGQLVTISPVFPENLKKDDIVFCKVNGNYYIHLIKEIKFSNKLYFQIGNNKNRINGWTSEDKIYGKVIDIQN